MPASTIKIISEAVAKPFLLKMAWRNGIMMNNARMPIRLKTPNCWAVNFFRFDKPQCLGNKLVVASGHTFLQTPTATTNNKGATGINMFQNTNSPSEG